MVRYAAIDQEAWCGVQLLHKVLYLNSIWAIIVTGFTHYVADRATVFLGVLGTFFRTSKASPIYLSIYVV